MGERIIEVMDERDVWKISVIIEATEAQADAALEAIARALCPDEHHVNYCAVPWTTIVCKLSDLDDDERAAWAEDFDQDRNREREPRELKGSTEDT